MDVMCGWVWCEDVVSYHERGRLRPEGVGVIAHVHYVDSWRVYDSLGCRHHTHTHTHTLPGTESSDRYD